MSTKNPAATFCIHTPKPTAAKPINRQMILCLFIYLVASIIEKFFDLIEEVLQ